MSDPNRIDLTPSINTPRLPPRSLVHLRGYHGDYGENEGVLALTTVLDEGMNSPECARIIVGSPGKSPLLEGYLPKLGGFSCSPDAADRLADELKAAASAARAAMAKERP